MWIVRITQHDPKQTRAWMTAIFPRQLNTFWGFDFAMHISGVQIPNLSRWHWMSRDWCHFGINIPHQTTGFFQTLSELYSWRTICLSYPKIGNVWATMSFGMGPPYVALQIYGTSMCKPITSRFDDKKNLLQCGKSARDSDRGHRTPGIPEWKSHHYVPGQS